MQKTLSCSTTIILIIRRKKNNALILEEDGKLLSMVSMTPYQVCVKTDGIFRKVESTYLVGVATRQEWRRHGFMGRLLKEACGELNAAGQPFAFLQPAAPEIYEPFQFAYIYDKPQWIFQPEFGLMADDLLEGESREPVFIRDGRKILQAAENVLEKKRTAGIRYAGGQAHGGRGYPGGGAFCGSVAGAQVPGIYGTLRGVL
ncbi:MAG: GNAT family N-acetyltransferase [Eisenbergiella massiliensis]